MITRSGAEVSGVTTNASEPMMKRSALVIDDSRAVRFVVSRILRDLGYEVSEAVHGAEALAQIQAGADPTVALVDWNMPTMNGLEFVQAVRSEVRYADMRLMMVTSETEQSFVTSALEAGADEYLMKPFTREILIEKLAVLGL